MTAFKTWSKRAQVATTALIAMHKAMHKETKISQEDHAILARYNSRTFRRLLKRESEPKGEYLKKLEAYVGIKA